MTKATGKPRKKSSTSGEFRKDPPRVTPGSLGQQWIGQEVLVFGRDVTLGLHTAAPVLLRGEVEAIHVNSTRARVVLVMETVRDRKIKTTRVIEVTG